MTACGALIKAASRALCRITICSCRITGMLCARDAVGTSARKKRGRPRNCHRELQPRMCVPQSIYAASTSCEWVLNARCCGCVLVRSCLPLSHANLSRVKLRPSRPIRSSRKTFTTVPDSLGELHPEITTLCDGSLCDTEMICVFLFKTTAAVVNSENLNCKCNPERNCNQKRLPHRLLGLAITKMSV